MTATRTTSEWVRLHPGPRMRHLEELLQELLAEQGDGSPELLAEMRARAVQYRAEHDACEAALRGAEPAAVGVLLEDALDAKWARINAETIVSIGRVRALRPTLAERFRAVFGRR